MLAVVSLSLCAQETPKRKTPAGWQWVFNNRPSVRYGTLLRLDFTAKLQNDWRVFNPPQETDAGTYEFRRRRFGVEGRLGDDWEFEIEAEAGITQNIMRDLF